MEQIIDTEFDVDLTDMFTDEGSDGNQTEETEEVTEEVAENTDTGAGNTENPEAGQTEPQQETPKDTDGGNHTEDAFLEVNVLGNKQTYTKDQAVELVQKGADYDRVHGKYNELKGQVEQLTKEATASKSTMDKMQELAKLYGKNGIDEFADMLHMNYFMKAKGMDQQTAQQAVQNERVKAELAANQARKAEMQRQQAAQAEARQRQEKELMEFVKAYPGVTQIPQEVLNDVNAGNCTLLYGYRQYLRNQEMQTKQNEQAAKAEMQERSAKNAAASLGSAKTSGQNKAVDGFLAGFEAAF